MDNRIGWKFPPTNGGVISGFNDPSIAHFKGDPIPSLARETIQNSLDARKNHEKPVHVSFELIPLKDGSAFGKKELSSVIQRCMDSPICKEDDKAELESALAILNNGIVNCLIVSDRNTTGLRVTEQNRDLWQTLVKTPGLSEKDNRGAGGSHGIGKAAPFAVTPLRTVFYWTHYSENGRPVEKFQGKAVLMSHMNGEEEAQGTGFYGFKDGCKELTGRDVPNIFRLRETSSPDSRPVQGTALNILGFSAEGNWRMRIAESVIANYFYAIDNKKLEVSIEPDEEMGRRELLEINAETIDSWLDFLCEKNAPDEIKDARALRRLINEGKLIEKQDKDLGHCRLWILVDEDLPCKVGIVRGTGMLITTRQRDLIQFRSYRSFAALCFFDDPAGNELLRKMENPQHDQFEPNRIKDEEERERGRKALNRITRWIRNEIKKQAGPPEGGQKMMLSELAHYLPDYDPEEMSDTQSGEDGGSKEPAFAGRITLKRTPRPVQRRLRVEIDDSNGANGGENGEEGGRSEEGQGGGGNSISDGPGEGQGEGGTGTRGGGYVSTGNFYIKGPHPGDPESIQLLSNQFCCRGERHGAFASAGGGRFRSVGTPRYSLNRSKQTA